MFKKSFEISFIMLVSSLLNGCSLAVLNPHGLIAAKEIHLMLVSAALMLIVVIPVVFMAIFFSWRYRETNTKACYKPLWSHSVLLEIIWWSIPCCIIGILAIMTWYTTHELDPYRPLDSSKPPLIVQVVALEWKWLFIYPEQNIATINYLQLPVDVPVELQITSEGPMNSLLIPQLAGQIYAMAGMRSQLHLIANKTGDYPGFSANFSGNGFSDMKFVTHIATQSDFDAWVAQVQTSKNILDKTAYENLKIASENDQVKFFSGIYKNLFRIAVMKEMMPMKEVELLCK